MMAADRTFEAYESIAGESLARVTTQPVQHLIAVSYTHLRAHET